MSKVDYDTQKLLNPQLLSDEEIRNLLIARWTKTETFEEMTRGELLDFYCRYTMPLEQRERYRKTGDNIKENSSSTPSTSRNISEGLRKRHLNTHENTELKVNDFSESNGKCSRLSGESLQNGEGTTKKRLLTRHTNDDSLPEKRSKHELITWP